MGDLPIYIFEVVHTVLEISLFTVMNFVAKKLERVIEYFHIFGHELVVVLDLVKLQVVLVPVGASGGELLAEHFFEVFLLREHLRELGDWRLRVAQGRFLAARGIVAGPVERRLRETRLKVFLDGLERVQRVHGHFVGVVVAALEVVGPQSSALACAVARVGLVMPFLHAVVAVRVELLHIAPWGLSCVDLVKLVLPVELVHKLSTVEGGILGLVMLILGGVLGVKNMPVFSEHGDAPLLGGGEVGRIKPGRVGVIQAVAAVG